MPGKLSRWHPSRDQTVLHVSCPDSEAEPLAVHSTNVMALNREVSVSQEADVCIMLSQLKGRTCICADRLQYEMLDWPFQVLYMQVVLLLSLPDN